MLPEIEHSLKQGDYYTIEGGVRTFHDILLTLDNKYFLFHQEHPPSPIFISPKIGNKLDFNQIRFYNDCIAYLHDIPFIFYSPNRANITPYKPILESSGDLNIYQEDYYASIGEILNSIVNVKINGDIVFMWEKAYRKTINVTLESKYRKVFRDIQLYSMALKQIDPLMEFLCYYRVIESISRNNGKNWIKENLKKSLSFNYGFLEIYHPDIYKRNMKKINLFSLYKKKARSRLKHLNLTLNNTPIEEHLYKVIRCGVAHGKDKIVEYDYGLNLQDVAQDVLVVKLLARYGIEEQLKKQS